MDCETLLFNFLQQSNAQINANRMVMQFVAGHFYTSTLLLKLASLWQPVLENFTWCDSTFPHHGSLVCFLFVNILSELFTGTQSLHFQGLGTPRPWSSHWTCCRSEMCKGHVHFILQQCKITNSERLDHREPHHHCRWAEAELPMGGKKRAPKKIKMAFELNMQLKW